MLMLSGFLLISRLTPVPFAITPITEPPIGFRLGAGVVFASSREAIWKKSPPPPSFIRPKSRKLCRASVTACGSEVSGAGGSMKVPQQAGFFRQDGGGGHVERAIGAEVDAGSIIAAGEETVICRAGRACR
jgi:hypothetical protein